MKTVGVNLVFWRGPLRILLLVNDVKSDAVQYIMYFFTKYVFIEAFCLFQELFYNFCFLTVFLQVNDREWTNQDYHFNWVGSAMLSLFTSSTGEGWPA